MALDLMHGAIRGPIAVGLVVLVAASVVLAMSGRSSHAQDGLACPEPDDADAPISVSVGAQFVVALAANVTTGYSWELDDPGDTVIVQFVDKQYVAPGTDVLGAGGKECWTFQALAEGSTTLGLGYRRPFEPPSIPPVRTKQITVTVSP